MTWNYRIVNEAGRLSMREVYYNDNGQPRSWSIDKVSPEATSIEELRAQIRCLEEALEQGVLKVDDSSSPPTLLSEN